MQIGIIGAGRVGCSMGKYLVGHGADVLGYYDTNDRAAEEAAQFTGTERYDTLAELVSASKLIFITTPDGIILSVWEQIRHLPLAQKIICHCSGALSSDSFSGIEDTRAACLSIHPMLPFSNRFSSYEQLEKAFLPWKGILRRYRSCRQCLKDLETGYAAFVRRISPVIMQQRAF